MDVRSYGGCDPPNTAPHTLGIAGATMPAGTWHPPGGGAAGKALEAALPREAGLEKGTVSRRSIAFTHTFLLMVLFFPPFVLCLTLGMSPDVAYFSGRRGLAPVLLIPLLLCVPVAHLIYRPKEGIFFILSVLIPVVLFAGVGGMIRERTEITANALYNRDCFAFTEKRSLHVAHVAAQDLLGTCHAEKGFETEALSNCPGYNDFMRKYSREMLYLHSLETRFQCAGICHTSMQLFENPGTLRPSCGLFVAQWLHGASTQALAVLWYSIFVFCATIPCYNKIVKPLVLASD